MLSQRIGQGCGRHQTLRGELRDHGRDDRLKRIIHTFAGQITEHLALRVDDHDRRPGPHAVCRPNAVIAVVDDGVGQAVALRDHADVRRVALVLELGRMNADDGQYVAKLGLETVQVRDDVDAVDAAIRPEVEQDDAPLEIGDRQRLVDVDPVQIGREVGCSNPTSIGLHRRGRGHGRVSCSLGGWRGVRLGLQSATRNKQVAQQVHK